MGIKSPLRVIDFMNMTSKLDKFEIRNCLQLTGVDHLTYKNLLNLSFSKNMLGVWEIC